MPRSDSMASWSWKWRRFGPFDVPNLAFQQRFSPRQLVCGLPKSVPYSLHCLLFGFSLHDFELPLAHRWISCNPHITIKQVFIFLNCTGGTCLEHPLSWLVAELICAEHSFTLSSFTQPSLRRRKNFLGQWYFLIVWHLHSYSIPCWPPSSHN